MTARRPARSDPDTAPALGTADLERLFGPDPWVYGSPCDIIRTRATLEPLLAEPPVFDRPFTRVVVRGVPSAAYGAHDVRRPDRVRAVAWAIGRSVGTIAADDDTRRPRPVDRVHADWLAAFAAANMREPWAMELLAVVGAGVPTATG